MPGFSKCPCLRPQDDEIHILDYRHCSLDFLPSDVFAFERTLEELYLDANQIRDLPRELFYCHGLRKLSVSDNEIIAIPPAIASLINLEHLDISKNGIIDLPENIKQCKSLLIIEASVNPLGKLPEGFTQLLNLTELYLNDTFMDYLPGSFGRLSKLKILEIRENHLKTLPKSLSRLTQLERLDIGNNDFTELPEVLGLLVSLLELWCDTNKLNTISPCIGNLKQLMFLDASKNRIESLPHEIEGCVSLADLHISTNLLQVLPESVGRLSNLTTLKVDDNRLTVLPFSIGGLVSLSELNITANDLSEIPPSVGLLRHLRTMYADENFIVEIPPELGSCSGLTVLSLRSNNLTYVPDELGRIPRLRVLNLSDNRLKSLPYSLTRLKQIQALWLAENQTKPLVRLQSDVDPDTGQRVLTCYLLPQQPREDREDMGSDNNSFHPSMWEEERQQRQTIKFDFGDLDIEAMGRLERTPTPYPKEMKQRIQHMRNLALKQLNIPNGEVKQVMLEQQDVFKTNGQPPRVEGRGSPDKYRASNRAHKPYKSTEDIEASVRGASAHGLIKTSGTSPLASERHHLLRADKEKSQKDKARIRQNRNSQDGLDDLDNRSAKSTESLSKGKSKANRKSSSKQDLPAAKGDDGGFLDPNSNKRGTSPKSLPRSQTYPSGASYNGSIDPYTGQVLHGSVPPGGSLPPGAIPADAVPPSTLPPGSTYAEVPRTYEDFMRDLQSRSGPHQMWRDSNNIPRRPNSYHSSGSHHRRSRKSASQGYESDTGYRSEGVQSEILFTKKQKSQTLPGGRDTGYSSDWGSNHRHRHKTSGSNQGYASDMDNYSSRHRPLSNHQNNHYPNGVHNMYNGTGYHGSHGYHQSKQRHSATANSSHLGVQTQQQQQQHQMPLSTYSNIPTIARTTIRNDEKYESAKKKSSRSENSKNVTSSKVTGSSINSQSQEKLQHERDRISPVSGGGGGGGNLGEDSSLRRRRTGSLGDKEDRHSIRESTIKEEGSSDDDQYRAQLYQASVRLQKSPSDPHKRIQGGGKQLEASTPLKNNQTNSSATNSQVTPPYPEVPPYSPLKSQSRKNNYLSSQQQEQQQKYLDSPRSQNSSSGPHSQASPRDGNAYVYTVNDAGNYQNNNPSFSALTGSGDITNKANTLPVISHKRDGNSNSSSVISSANINTPIQKTGKLGYSTRSNTMNDISQPSEMDSVKNDHRQHRSDLDLRYDKGGPHQYGGVAGTPKSNKTFSGFESQSSLSPQSAHQSNAYGTPKNYGNPSCNYEQDVAVFKGKEPTSQMSSSTDSGYVHGHTMDRLSNEFKMSGSYSSPQKLSFDRTPSTTASPQKYISSTPQKNYSSPNTPQKMDVTIVKNPGLGFSIAGGLGSPGNPYRPKDTGIFITKVQADGPAAMTLEPGDKILQVNGVDFKEIEHRKAVDILRTTGSNVDMVTERC